MTTKSLILGISGQDGSYLADLLLEKGHEVYGVVRRSSSISTERVDHLLFPDERITLLYGDLANGLDGIIYDIQPDYIYLMASMSHVRVSFDIPIYTLDINAVGPTRVFEAVRKSSLRNKVRIYMANSSEQFGDTPPVQNENSKMNPQSPYGVAKLAAYHMARMYRKAYGMFISCGILFNHTSPRRGETFVTKKIIRGAVRISLGKQSELVLGNLSSKRDFGHSKDYMKAVIKILEHYEPDDFVVATGEHYSIEEFLHKVFGILCLNVQDHVKFNPKYLRPSEVPDLMGDPTKIKNILGWEPEVNLDQLISEMVCDIRNEEKRSEWGITSEREIAS